jgi:hypothetical protein
VDVPAGGGPARLVVRRRETPGGPLAEVGAADLDGVADPTALEVTAFDDRLRASVGAAVVEVDRGEIRAGRLCLTAEDNALFSSLQVRGLDMYAFPFAVSRFRSFTEHIGSWSGRLDEISPDALGPGTTTATVASLWSATAAAVTAAMAPDAPSAEREQAFATWVSALGLPLKDEVTELELSRLVDGAQTRALLIESPEPLDFTAEIELTLIQRKHVGPLPPIGPLPPVGPIAPTHLAVREARRRGDRRRRAARRRPATPAPPRLRRRGHAVGRPRRGGAAAAPLPRPGDPTTGRRQAGGDAGRAGRAAPPPARGQ